MSPKGWNSRSSRLVPTNAAFAISIVVVLAIAAVVCGVFVHEKPNEWVQLTQSGDVPAPRAYHRIVSSPDGRYIYSFGGNQGIYEFTLSNNLYRLDVETGTWVLLKPTGTLPKPRFRATMVYAQEKDLIVIFGGLYSPSPIEPGEILGDICIYDVNKNEWQSDVKTLGNAPAARFYHGAVISGDVMYVTGGNNDKQFFNDMHKYHISENRWEVVTATGAIPEGRSSAAIGISTVHNEIYWFAGLRWHGYEGYLNDVHVFDTVNNVWSLPLIRGPDPARRASTAGAVLGDNFYIFGGYDIDGRYLNDVWAFNPRAESTWSRVEPDSALPGVRSAHSATAIPKTNRMYINSGFIELMTTPARNLDDTWYYQV
eukprot:TRINITY_DN3594_c0_g1_i1.p1 TRINITY_DN3594_c0_g1~~TRINITY_DN3594_c0_g1_i1.p1  ORF type:complete len:370 (-),score=23.40 TRINITY_DN3594_c0_g1_i1:210-1319(-)